MKKKSNPIKTNNRQETTRDKNSKYKTHNQRVLITNRPSKNQTDK